MNKTIKRIKSILNNLKVYEKNVFEIEPTVSNINLIEELNGIIVKALKTSPEQAASIIYTVGLIVTAETILGKDKNE